MKNTGRGGVISHSKANRLLTNAYCISGTPKQRRLLTAEMNKKMQEVLIRSATDRLNGFTVVFRLRLKRRRTRTMDVWSLDGKPLIRFEKVDVWDYITDSGGNWVRLVTYWEEIFTEEQAARRAVKDAKAAEEAAEADRLAWERQKTRGVVSVARWVANSLPSKAMSRMNQDLNEAVSDKVAAVVSKHIRRQDRWQDRHSSDADLFFNSKRDGRLVRRNIGRRVVWFLDKAPVLQFEKVKKIIGMAYPDGERVVEMKLKFREL